MCTQTKTVNIGAKGGSPVISLNSDADNSNANPYISIGQGGTQGFGEDGIFMGFDSTTPKFSLYGNNGYVEFDGTDFDYSGGVTNSDIVGSTLTIGSGYSVFKANTNGIYLGSDTFAEAPFSVTLGGVAVIEDAQVSGEITAQNWTNWWLEYCR